jgi:multidrug efflux pump subunit AcrB
MNRLTRRAPFAHALAALLVPTALVAAQPPTIRVTADYPGASAAVLAEAVAAPLFEQIKGVENATHIWTECRDGRAVLTVVLKPRTDLAITQVLVQNRAALALPVMPFAVVQQGVSVLKTGPEDRPVLWLALTSPDGSRDRVSLSRLADELRDRLRIGHDVRGVALLGAERAGLSVWLDQDKLAALDLTVAEVLKALQEHNARAAPGPMGKPILVLDTNLDAGKAGGLVLRMSGDGRVLYLRDVAVIRAGGGPSGVVRIGGAPGVALAVSGASAAARKVKEELADLRRKLPKGVALDVAADLSAADVLRLELSAADRASEERMARTAEAVAARLKGLDGVTVVLWEARAGEADLLLRLDGPKRVAAVRERLAGLKDVAWRLARPQADVLPPPHRFPVALAVLADDDAAARRLAERLAAGLGKVPGLADVFVESRPPAPELKLVVDRFKAQALGVESKSVLDVIQIYLGGPVVDLDRFRRSWELRAPLPAEGGNAEDLLKLMVRSNEGKMVRLGTIAEVGVASAPSALSRLDGRPVVLLTAGLTPGADVADVRKAVREAVAAAWDGKDGRALLWGAGLDEPEDLRPKR